MEHSVTGSTFLVFLTAPPVDKKIMGKSIFLIIIGTFVAGSVLFIQASDTRIATTTTQAVYQEKVLAREIARSATGIAHMRLQQAGANYDLALSKINGSNHDGTPNLQGALSGALNNGTFKIKAIPLDGQNIKIESTGIFNDVEEKIVSYYRVDMLVVKEPSRLKVEFIESQAGWCSAVYLQQFIEIPPGQDLGDVLGIPADSAATIAGQISSDGLWFEKAPEMIFDSGHYRDGETVEPADIALATGTRMNFFIGVDQNCSEEGNWMEEFSDSLYDHIHYAMDHETSVTEMLEGTYAMIELNDFDDQTWRIAFEDQNFYTVQQYNDIKLKGYGDGNWDSVEGTWGGTGWGEDSDGYRDLNDWGNQPDYSDQVFEVELVPCGGPCIIEEVVDDLPL